MWRPSADLLRSKRRRLRRRWPYLATLRPAILVTPVSSASRLTTAASLLAAAYKVVS